MWNIHYTVDAITRIIMFNEHGMCLSFNKKLNALNVLRLLRYFCKEQIKFVVLNFSCAFNYLTAHPFLCLLGGAHD